MHPRHTAVSKANLLRFESRLQKGQIQNKLKSEQDFLSILLWLFLLVFALQGIAAGMISALAWVGLGAFTLIIKKKLPIRLLLLLEAPVFFGIICYSVTPIYLGQEEVTYTLAELGQAFEGMWLAWWGMVMFSVGLVLTLRGFKPAPAGQMINVTVKQAFFITLAGFFCNEILVSRVPLSIWAAIYIFGYCSPIGLFLLFRVLSQTDPDWIRTWKFVAWLFALIVWALHSVTGGIFGSTLLILMLFSSEYTQRSKLVLMGFIILAFIAAPLLQDAKSDYRQKIAVDVTQKESKLLEVFTDNFKKVFIEGEAGAYRNGIINLANRLCTLEIWLRVKDHLDRNQDFAGGATIKNSLLDGFIPRVAWVHIFGEEKPMRGGSSELARKYGEMPIVEGTSVGVGVIGEFYINAATWGVIVGMLLLGALGGLVLSFGINDRVQPLGLGMCIVVFSLFVRPDANFSDILGGIIRLVFLWWILRVWILRQSVRNTSLDQSRLKRVGV